MKFRFFPMKLDEFWCFLLPSRGVSCVPTRMEPWSARTMAVSNSRPEYSHLENPGKSWKNPRKSRKIREFNPENSLFGASTERNFGLTSKRVQKLEFLGSIPQELFPDLWDPCRVQVPLQGFFHVEFSCFLLFFRCWESSGWRFFGMGVFWDEGFLG